VTDAAGLIERARADPGLVVLEGFHALKHARRFGADVVLAVTSDPDGVARLAAELAPELDPGDLATVAPAVLGAHQHHTRVLAVARRPPFDPTAIGPGRVVLLEDPRHLGNVGAVIRVAAAAGAAAVLTTGASDPWHPAALRGSAGLHLALPVGRVDGPPPDRPLAALDPAGDPLAGLPADVVLAFGTERHGLSPGLRARAALRVAIPMRPGVSSLNLATAAAVALYAA